MARKKMGNCVLVFIENFNNNPKILKTGEVENIANKLKINGNAKNFKRRKE